MYKKVLVFALAIPLLVLPGCVRENDVTEVRGPMVTISASLPEGPLTKAGFSVPEEGTGLHLAWQEGDCIRVISGDASAVYQIDEGFTDHKASFSGPEVPGSVFDIICPGTYASVAEAEAGNPELTQTGNGSTAHLVFTAKLSDVAKADLPDITFSDAWVAEHAGSSLNRGGVRILTETEALRFTKDGAVCAAKDGEIRLEGFDTVITAAGSESCNSLEAELNGRVAELYVIGDAVKPRKFQDAVKEAAETALRI